MKAIYNKETSIITRLIDTTEQNIGKYLDENEDYKAYPFSNDLSKGENINKFTTEGRLRPNSELIADNLITLGEDKILDGEIIREMTEEERQEKYPNQTPVNLSQEKTVGELIAQKNKELASLKDQYVDADLDDNEALKTELKAKVQDLKQEISVLKESLEADKN